MRHVLVLAATLLAGSTVCTLAGERVTNPRAVVVRGMNAAFYDANSIGAGSDPKVGVNTDVQNLSVNCGPDGKTGVDQLRTTIPNPHICWAKLEDLEARNSAVILATDPLPNNGYHCLIRDITPNEMRKALHYKP